MEINSTARKKRETGRSEALLNNLGQFAESGTVAIALGGRPEGNVIEEEGEEEGAATGTSRVATERFGAQKEPTIVWVGDDVGSGLGEDLPAGGAGGRNRLGESPINAEDRQGVTKGTGLGVHGHQVEQLDGGPWGDLVGLVAAFAISEGEAGNVEPQLA